MLDFHLLFTGDLLFVSLLTVIYLLYSYFKKVKTDKDIKYILVFTFLFYWLFFILNIKFTAHELRGIAGISIIPSFIIYYLLIPIKKSITQKRILFGILIAYILFWLTLLILHFYSNM